MYKTSHVHVCTRMDICLSMLAINICMYNMHMCNVEYINIYAGHWLSAELGNISTYSTIK